MCRFGKFYIIHNSHLILLMLLTFPLENVISQMCHLKELDKCAMTILIFTGNPSGIATSEAELNDQCNHLRKTENCVRNFTRKCMTSLQQELIGFATEGTYRLIDGYCTPGNQLRSSFLKRSASCWNKGQQQDQRNCVKEFHEVLNTLASSSNSDDRIRTGCCAYRRFNDCTRTSLEVKCGKETVEFMHVLLRMALSHLPDAVCQNYASRGDGERECDRSSVPDRPKYYKEGRKNILSRFMVPYAALR